MYLGILLAAAAAFALWTQFKDDPTDPTRLWLSVGTALVLLAAGWPVGRSEDRAMQRIGATLWLLGTIAVGFATLDGYVVASGAGELPDVTTFAVGVAVLVVGGGAYLLRPKAATQVAAFLGVATTVIGLPTWLLADPDTRSWVTAIALLLLGSSWLALDGLGRLSPARVGGVLAAIAVIVAPMFPFAVAEGRSGSALLVGVAGSAALLVAGVRLAGWAGTALAGLGLFGYLTGAILHFFGETVGAPLALLIGAVVLLGVAFGFVRLGRSARGNRTTP